MLQKGQIVLKSQPWYFFLALVEGTEVGNSINIPSPKSKWGGHETWKLQIPSPKLKSYELLQC